MNPSIETYTAPNTVADQAFRPSRGSILREGGHRDQHDPDRDEERATALEDLRERGVQDDDDGQGRAERRDGLVAGGAKQSEDLDRRRGRR